MAKKKKIILTVVGIVFFVELILSFYLNFSMNIGTNPETGKFGIYFTEEIVSMQDKINEETQPDQFLLQSEVVAKYKADHPEWTIANIIAEAEKTKSEEDLEHLKEHLPWGNTSIYLLVHSILGDGKTINAIRMIRMMLIVDLILIIFAVMVRRKIRFRPGKLQVVAEMMYDSFEGLVGESLGKHNVGFTPYLLTLFLFIWISNLIGIVPIRGISEPTRNLNVTIGLGIIAIVVVQYNAIKAKGLWGHLKSFAEPMFFLFPLNVIGELSKVVSIAFRLFGNIMGGAIIILVVSELVRYIMVPLVLSGFFGLFAGSVQAFVFTMLAMSYLAVEINGEE
ncbi:MAG: ATP synthase F0 subunit A [Candidatus Cloacimonetes bacterium 4572_65]|nr:MAG: ATP synthase F0 subunit A [Candidatus Cloacimonetes bacterium 4572_65]